MNTHFSPTAQQVRRYQMLRPNFSEIARRMEVTPQHVRRVFMGLSTSARVMREIEASIRRKAREGKKQRKVAA